MSKIHVEDKTVVVPGEVLADGMDYIPGNGAYRNGEQIMASRVGLTSINGRTIKLIPLAGPYLPKRDDIVICQASDITMNGWRINIFSPNPAMLNVRDATNQFISKGADLSKIIAIGDYMAAKVTNVTTQKLVDITLKGPGLRKLEGGQIIRFTPTKFPRVIGKAGSMVSTIKSYTDCYIIVGQNGYIWISGEPEKEVIAVEAIKMIERLAHTSGLTEKIKDFLESKGLEPKARDDRNNDDAEDEQ